MAEKKIAELRSVSQNDDGEVFATFKVIDNEYIDYIKRWSSRQQKDLVVRGDGLFVKEKGQMRTAPGKEI